MHDLHSAPTVGVDGSPAATLIELSRSAAMLCVGSIAIAHACQSAGSTAAALAESAGCPVAVIRHPDAGQRADAGNIVAEADASPENNAVLGWAMAEARLRGAPLRVITSAQSQPGDMEGDPSTRRIDRWPRQYPDVVVEPVAVQGSVVEHLADCLAEEAESIQLLVPITAFERAGFG
ncbi:MAG TPA: hypothetical protein VFQ37_01475 [Mycobacterium sp.]|nr:hypothetical protein [Mycobacterium sp.]